jgi:hypothetical protein
MKKLEQGRFRRKRMRGLHGIIYTKTRSKIKRVDWGSGEGKGTQGNRRGIRMQSVV